MKSQKRIVGQTKDVGFQIGASKTMEVTPERAWGLLTSPDGLALWLGRVSDLRLEPGEMYETEEGSRGEIRVNSGSHLRLTWQPPGWPEPSTVQVRVIPSGEKTVISFHQEKLSGPDVREEMRTRWKGILADLQKRFTQED